jgi:hypothetical protein
VVGVLALWRRGAHLFGFWVIPLLLCGPTGEV